jgi:hypothetical protein
MRTDKKSIHDGIQHVVADDQRERHGINNVFENYPYYRGEADIIVFTPHSIRIWEVKCHDTHKNRRTAYLAPESQCERAFDAHDYILDTGNYLHFVYYAPGGKIRHRTELPRKKDEPKTGTRH